MKKIFSLLFLLISIGINAQSINNLKIKSDSVSITMQFHNMSYYYDNEFFYNDDRQITLLNQYSIFEFKTQLKWALKNVKKNVCGRFGRFGLNRNTQMIYLYDDFAFTVLTIKEAKILLKQIKKWEY